MKTLKWTYDEGHTYPWGLYCEEDDWYYAWNIGSEPTCFEFYVGSDPWDFDLPQIRVKYNSVDEAKEDLKQFWEEMIND